MKENLSISILPKGSIFLALGGYVGEHEGLPVKKNTEAVINALTYHLKEGKTALVYDGKQLIFVPISENKPKKWWQF